MGKGDLGDDLICEGDLGEGEFAFVGEGALDGDAAIACIAFAIPPSSLIRLLFPPPLLLPRVANTCSPSPSPSSSSSSTPVLPEKGDLDLILDGNPALSGLKATVPGVLGSDLRGMGFKGKGCISPVVMG